MSAEIAFGQRVLFTRTLMRRHEHDTRSHSYGRKVWKSEGYPGQPEPDPRPGIMIGVRSLANGYITGGGWEDPLVFHSEQTFTAYLVAYHPRRRPVLVLPEHIAVPS